MRAFVGLLSVIVSLLGVALPLAFGAVPGRSPQDAARFVEQAEAELLDLWIRSGRADWVAQSFITQDTELLTAAANEAVIAATTRLAQEATAFDGLDLPPDVARKLKLIKLSLVLPAPADPKLRRELTEIAAGLNADYGRGKYCPPGKDPAQDCLDLGALEDILATSRDPQVLLDAWAGWRTISPPMRPKYQRFVELTNQGARELGFADTGALWRSKYDMPPDAFAQEMQRLWSQVEPLYASLHCYVRTRLQQRYGKEPVPDGRPIPAHLLGNMWAQDWSNVYDLVKPQQTGATSIDLTGILKARKVDELEMVRFGERFFSGLGQAPLPKTFWERSLFRKPADRDVVCHASAWDIDFEDDIRIKMCIKINAEDFVTIHHELGHNYYQRAYKNQPPLFRESANDGFHEALGDTLALSITPKYLAQIGLIDKEPENAGDIELLLQRALEKVAFLPFGLMVDEWRWGVFAGQIKPGQYNQAWWDLALKYQGVVPPVARSEADFDPGAKYHIPANTPYARYFLAHVLQFQFHQALTDVAGEKGPLHRRTINGSKAAGERLERMMAMGQSKPWPDALEVLAGTRRMDGGAVALYFAPLKKWLDEQNRGQKCGW